MILKKIACLLLTITLLQYFFAQKVIGQNIVSFAENQATAYEADFKPAVIVVKRSNSKDALTISLDIKTTAIAGKDFVELPKTINFKDGQSEANIIIQPMTDYSFSRNDKKIRLSLIAGDGYSISAEASINVTIIQDPSSKKLPSDSIFFSKLNYTFTGLSAVKEAVAKGNYKAARKALAKYYQKRSGPIYPYERKDPNKTVIQEALQNTYSVTGLKYNFGEGRLDSIDWSYSVEGNPNWSWEINRFAWWKDLTQAYLDNQNEGDIYAKRLFFELEDWLKNSPIDVTIRNQLQAGNRWRHLECGIRLETSWTLAFSLLKNSPILSDDLLVDWVKGFYQHCRFLEVNAELSTNRGFSEANGLFTASVFFPEFAEATGWQQLALQRMENVLKSDVNSDGTLKELSPGYHNVTFGVVQKFIDFANANKIALSPLVLSSTEKLLGYYVSAVEPTGTYPLMNDSYKFKATNQLKYGYNIFPAREDFQYLATDKSKGKPPIFTSILLADAGQAIMRSGWKNNDNYLLMDAGPFGTSHGHEDKLSINVDGYGIRHIIDCGPYNYEDTNPYRIYSVGSHGKSIPLVDDLDQNRKAITKIYARKSNVAWFTSDKFDYAAGTYGADTLEAWGKNLVRPATITRHIFYLKPDIWVVIDAFTALDKNQHTYSSLFQCSDDNLEVDNTNKTVTIQLLPSEFDPFNRIKTNKIQPSLTITPLLSNGLSLSIAKGQESPTLSGWQFEKSTTWKKQAIPTARYYTTASGNVQMSYVLAAAPAELPVRKPIITSVATNQDTYGLKVNVGNATSDIILLVALNGNTINWKDISYKSKALIIINENGNEKILETGNGF